MLLPGTGHAYCWTVTNFYDVVPELTVTPKREYILIGKMSAVALYIYCSVGVSVLAPRVRFYCTINLQEYGLQSNLSMFGRSCFPIAHTQ